MDATLKQQLKTSGATVEGNQILHFHEVEQEREFALNQPCLSLLSDFGHLSVQGNNSQSFLQGQTTCDLRSISVGHGHFGACCNPKGRILANFLIWSLNKNHFLLTLSANMLSALQTHLSKFAPFSKIELALFNSIGDETLAIWNVNQQLIEQITDIIGPPSNHVHYFTPHKLSYLYVRLKSTLLATQWSALTKLLRPVGLHARQLADIHHGISFIQPATQGQIIPQMIAWEQWGGVSFDKGCYVGQEIIARTQHLGQLKRHTYHFSAHTSVLPEVGALIENSQQENIGIVTAATWKHASSHRCIGLAVCQDARIRFPCQMTSTSTTNDTNDKIQIDEMHALSTSG